MNAGAPRCAGLPLRELARVRAARMIGRDQDPQIPRRRVGMRLAERLDGTRSDRRRAASTRAPCSPGFVERQLLRRRPVVERLLGVRVADEQRNVRRQRRARSDPTDGRESPCRPPSASSAVMPGSRSVIFFCTAASAASSRAIGTSLQLADLPRLQPQFGEQQIACTAPHPHASSNAARRRSR